MTYLFKDKCLPWVSCIRTPALPRSTYKTKIILISLDFLVSISQEHQDMAESLVPHLAWLSHKTCIVWLVEFDEFSIFAHADLMY